MRHRAEQSSGGGLGAVLPFRPGTSGSSRPTGPVSENKPSEVPGAGQGSGPEGPTPADHYGEVFDRVSSKVQEGDRMASQEKDLAPIAFARLLVLKQEERLSTIRTDAEFQSYLLAEMFLERSRQSWHDDAKVAIESAQVARAIAQQLSEELYSSSLRAGLEARCSAFLAQSFRVAGRLAEADEEFRRLIPVLPEVILEPYERAEILGFWSASLTERGQFDRAMETLLEVHDIYVREKDDQKVGRTLIYMAVTCTERGDHEKAVELLEKSLDILDEDRSYKLVTVALVNLAVGLHGVGQYDRALSVVHETRARMEGQRDRIFRARLRWIEARVLASLGRLEEAEGAFQEVLQFFADREVDIDAALVCLDLAVLYVGENRTDSVKSLAQRMLPVFSSQGFGREVMAALILFQQAAEREIATMGLIKEISKYVERAFRISTGGSAEL